MENLLAFILFFLISSRLLPLVTHLLYFQLASATARCSCPRHARIPSKQVGSCARGVPVPAVSPSRPGAASRPREGPVRRRRGERGRVCAAEPRSWGCAPRPAEPIRNPRACAGQPRAKHGAPSPGARGPAPGPARVEPGPAPLREQDEAAAAPAEAAAPWRR